MEIFQVSFRISFSLGKIICCWILGSGILLALKLFLLAPTHPSSCPSLSWSRQWVQWTTMTHTMVSTSTTAWHLRLRTTPTSPWGTTKVIRWIVGYRDFSTVWPGHFRLDNANSVRIHLLINANLQCSKVFFRTSKIKNVLCWLWNFHSVSSQIFEYWLCPWLSTRYTGKSLPSSP